jgi:hypothetical protein
MNIIQFIFGSGTACRTDLGIACGIGIELVSFIFNDRF